jgi:hypothetical protein
MEITFNGPHLVPALLALAGALASTLAGILWRQLLALRRELDTKASKDDLERHESHVDEKIDRLINQIVLTSKG